MRYKCEERTTYVHSSREKMNASIAFVLSAIIGSTLAYYVQREAPYDVGYNYQYPVQEPSQRLFWGNGGSNQVGSTGGGFWTHLTNKFPFLENMFGRMQLQTQYGALNQYNLPTKYGPPGYQPNFYQAPGYFQYFQQGVPTTRDVALTDDAVIVSSPQFPAIEPAPAPFPVPAPAPVPSPVVPPTQPVSGGYRYDKPLYRLELPKK